MYPQVFGKYVLERELARGGMARVLLATLRGADGFEKKLVVKQIRDELACDDEFVSRFVLEAKTTVNLAHPNIVPVYELGVERGTYFLAMEFVEGASLDELLRARRGGDRARASGDGSESSATRAGLSPEEVAYVGVEVCRALDYAHRRMNVVHRDVTPRNVMVDEEGQVKVIDFGIAAPVATASSGHGVFGSPGHMPPEQMEAKELTPAADVFAVAVLLMELWSGKAPFRRRSREEIEASMRSPHPRPSDADARLLPLDDVIASAMSLDPMARPQQADDLGRALRRFLAGVELGDLARHLGDRVRDLRLHPPPPPTEPRPILQRPPSRPIATQVGTKTFAARHDVASIRPTAPPPPSPEAIPEISTRRIESRPPDPLSRESDAVASDTVARERPRESDTVAIEPLEAATRRDAAPPRRSLALFGAGTVGAGALTIAAFFLGRAATTPTQAASLAPQASLAVPAAASRAEAQAPTTPHAIPVPSPSFSPSSAPSSSASAVAASPAERAQLVLLGNGTFVAVDGVARGACPARVTLDPGPHTVVFSFPPTGESKGETLTLRAGDRETLHADFTGAAPSIRTQPR